MFVVYLFIIFWISQCYSDIQELKYPEICEKYFECIEERESIFQSCQTNGKLISENCKEEMRSEIDMISEFESRIKNGSRKCVDDQIREMNTQIIGNHDVIRFCSSYLNKSNNQKNYDCFVSLGRISNRCEALRRCCEPVSRCEQTWNFSEIGRKLVGMREEIGIKLAECSENGNKNREVTKIKKPKKLLRSPPFHLCLQYLKCQKDVYSMRIECSKNSTKTTVDNIETYEPDCRQRLQIDFEKMNERRREAFAYLDKCVPVANVTREFLITERVCRPKMIRSISRIIPKNCHVAVIQKRKECLLLRDCCVQADVCERSALYGVISDEYLRRRMEISKKLEECDRNSIYFSNNI